MPHTETAWCPGCGNFSILDIMMRALAELDIRPENLVMVSGIGQAGKTPHYFRCNVFNGLHGRAIPAATAIKASNPKLVVIAEGGDGDMYGEGGNHFMHAIRRNPDITVLVHNNMVYGLTKGQASPTSLKGFRTPVQVKGVYLEPVNPLSLAISQGATFVSRAYCADREETGKVLKEAVAHRGFSLVDIYQPCVTFNKVNTYRWFKEKTYYLDESHDASDRGKAFEKSIEKDALALGVFYREEGRDTFEDNAINRNTPVPLYKYRVNRALLEELLDKKRTRAPELTGQR